MIGYHLQLALHSLRRTPVLSLLIVKIIALGIGVALTMLTVLHNLSGDPLPQLSSNLYHPQLDPRPAKLTAANPEPPDDLTWQDAINLQQLPAPGKRSISSSNWLPSRPADSGKPLQMLPVRANTAELFSMFGINFIHGQAWTAIEDRDRAQVVVITRRLSNTLFGTDNSVGQKLELATRMFQIIGVVADWNPQPRFYDLNSGAYKEAEEIFVPFSSWLELPQDYGYGPMRCWAQDINAGLHNPKAADCTWVQFWVQLDSPVQHARFHQALHNYSVQQQQLGRFERAPNLRLRNLLEWLEHKRVIPPSVRMQTWIAFGVLLVCLCNASGLLLAKFMRKSVEIGVRRALGASRTAILQQCLCEAAMFGVLGGLLGLPMSWLGLWMVRQQPVNYASQVELDPLMLLVAPLLALLCALAAGSWPAWRATRIAPALQVKSL